MSAIFHAGISGYRGRMGRAVSQVLDARDDVVVAARIDWGDEADLSLWFGGADSLAEARRQARGARIECGLSAAPPALRALALGTPA